MADDAGGGGGQREGEGEGLTQERPLEALAQGTHTLGLQHRGFYYQRGMGPQWPRASGILGLISSPYRCSSFWPSFMNSAPPKVHTSSSVPLLTLPPCNSFCTPSFFHPTNLQDRSPCSSTSLQYSSFELLLYAVGSRG